MSKGDEALLDLAENVGKGAVKLLGKGLVGLGKLSVKGVKAGVEAAKNARENRNSSEAVVSKDNNIKSNAYYGYDEIDYRAFGEALKNMQLDAVQNFLDAGANARRSIGTIMDDDDEHLIIVFAQHAQYTETGVKILKLMLDAGADANMRASECSPENFWFMTVLGCLTSHKINGWNDEEFNCMYQMIKLLVDAGADINANDEHRGRSILECANEPCRQILIDFGAGKENRAVSGKTSSKAAFCSQCGNPLAENARFCSSCGAQVG